MNGITTEEFDEAIRHVARGMGVDALLAVPGVWEVISEELNNAAIAHVGGTAEPDVARACDECGGSGDGPNSIPGRFPEDCPACGGSGEADA